MLTTFSRSVAGALLSLPFFAQGPTRQPVAPEPTRQGTLAARASVPTRNPILFVTQVPVALDYLTIASTFGNHQPTPRAVPRGGDLWIRYGDGTLRNLTKEAGFGAPSGFQGAKAIAVREPSVHWSGTKAVFSMIVGAPASPGLGGEVWQLYEVTGLKKGQQAVIRRVPKQPATYSNVSPCYASDGRILFASDRPRNGAAHLHPQLDEYEEAPATTGLWSLDPATGDLFLLQHSPSGSFSPSVDSYGRVVFSRWDHLERDQQADQQRLGQGTYGTFNYASEAPNARNLGNDDEVFPEPRRQWIDYINSNPGYSGPLRGWEPYLIGHHFNRFLPWQVDQDGRGEETLGHVGRQELVGTFERTRKDDPNLRNHYLYAATVANKEPIENLRQVREDPLIRGLYYGIDGPEFDTHGSGQVLALFAPEGLSPDRMLVFPITPRETRTPTTTPGPRHTGFYRNPLRLSDGLGVAAHTANTQKESNLGTPTQPRSRFDFRLKLMVPDPSGYLRAGPALTPGFTKSVQYYDPYQLVSWSGTLWELDPAEVVARPAPAPPARQLELPERLVLFQEQVSEAALVSYLEQRGLALVVSRDVTTRDQGDIQQPYNLRVYGGGKETRGSGGKSYDVTWMRFYQGDQVRGLTGTPNPNDPPKPGRRVLAQPLHGVAHNFPAPGAPSGSVPVAPDGSVAALVPARRAMSWELLDPAGDAIVRERYWISFQPGEIRACTSCHGANEADQAGNPPAQNPPEALRYLLRYLRAKGEI